MPVLFYEIFNNNKAYNPIIFCCDHANNNIPQNYNNLGLSPQLLESHIAYDIGARSVTLELAKYFKTYAILGKFSRLLIDLNRAESNENIIPKSSDGIDIPSNICITKLETKNRIKEYHLPYHKALNKKLHSLDRKFNRKTSLVCIHSFAPSLQRKKIRPWHIGLLHRDDKKLMKPIFNYLKNCNNLKVKKNVPYSGYDDVNYTMTKHGELEKRPFITIEIRNDLITNIKKQTFKKITRMLIKSLSISQEKLDNQFEKSIHNII